MPTLTDNTYRIFVDDKLDPEKLQQGIFLFLYRATRIPPHIGLIFNGKIYDITLIGPTLGIDASDFINTIVKKYTKTLFIELKTPNILENEIIDVLENEVKRFYKVTENNTCLSPIKTAFEKFYSLPTTEVQYIFDLIPLLEMKHLISNVFHLNMERNLTSNYAVLQRYNQDVINQSITALNRKNAIC